MDRTALSALTVLVYLVSSLRAAPTGLYRYQERWDHLSGEVDVQSETVATQIARLTVNGGGGLIEAGHLSLSQQPTPPTTLLSIPPSVHCGILHPPLRPIILQKRSAPAPAPSPEPEPEPAPAPEPEPEGVPAPRKYLKIPIPSLPPGIANKPIVQRITKPHAPAARKALLNLNKDMSKVLKPQGEQSELIHEIGEINAQRADVIAELHDGKTGRARRGELTSQLEELEKEAEKLKNGKVKVYVDKMRKITTEAEGEFEKLTTSTRDKDLKGITKDLVESVRSRGYLPLVDDPYLVPPAREGLLGRWLPWF